MTGGAGPGRPLTIGFDLGGTQFRAAAAAGVDVVPGLAGVERLVARSAPQSLDELIAAIAAAVVELGARCSAGSGPSLRHGSGFRVGFTVPGLVDGTTCRWVPNLGYLDGVDLAALLAAALDPTPSAVVVGNDAHLSLVAEAVAGAARDAGTALLLAIGTGIGSAVLADGVVVRGSSGGACSFGWACADIAAESDDRHGWLERQASGSALDGAARALAHRAGRELTSTELVSAARSGDAEALAALGPIARALGTTLAGAVGLLDPAVVVISGGVADALDVVLPEVRAALEAQLPPHLRAVPIRPGAFGPDAGLAGALIAAARGAPWWTTAGADR